MFCSFPLGEGKFFAGNGRSITLGRLSSDAFMVAIVLSILLKGFCGGTVVTDCDK
jgi:hypothetical protein